MHVELLLDGNPCDLEVDTGAAVSILSEKRVNKVLPGAQLQKTSVSLHTYTSQRIPVKGKLEVEVQYGQQRKSLTCYVLLRREWRWSLPHGKRLAQACLSQVERDRSDHSGN